jgi:hypothetical protein
MKLTEFMFATLLLIASVPLALAQGTYTQIDVPGATGTSGRGIDTAGDIVGSYLSGASDVGFLLSGGVYSTIKYPGSELTFLFGINDNGQIVGSEFGVGSFGFLTCSARL